MKRLLIMLIVPLTVLSVSSKGFTDKRSYVWTYEYLTLDEGEAELEYYSTLSTLDTGDFKGTTSSEHQLELEVGMGGFDFAIYQVFDQASEEKLRYKGYKLRLRKKLFKEKGMFFVDPLLYLEYKGKPNFSEHAIELKTILAKDFGRFNVSLNPVLELEYDVEKEEWEVEPEYALGASYKIHNLLKVGLEGKGSESGHYIGPTISHGEEDLWFTLGSAFKISGDEKDKSEFQIRFLLGVKQR